MPSGFVDTTWRIGSLLSIWRNAGWSHRGSLQEREPTAWEGSTRAGGNDWRNKSQPASTRARFEVRNVSLFGSTELANAGVGCNIAQIIVSEGNE
jgi:hypothetical protein